MTEAPSRGALENDRPSWVELSLSAALSVAPANIICSRRTTWLSPVNPRDKQKQPLIVVLISEFWGHLLQSNRELKHETFSLFTALPSPGQLSTSLTISYFSLPSFLSEEKEAFFSSPHSDLGTVWAFGNREMAKHRPLFMWPLHQWWRCVKKKKKIPPNSHLPLPACDHTIS